ncbi:hypothetical protein, partial [Corynebacterium parakroppenstedtii]
ILVKFSWHIPDFPIYSNGTKPGTLQHGVVKYSSLVVGLKITAVVTVILSLGVTLLVYERCVHTPVG